MKFIIGKYFEPIHIWVCKECDQLITVIAEKNDPKCYKKEIERKLKAHLKKHEKK